MTRFSPALRAFLIAGLFGACVPGARADLTLLGRSSVSALGAFTAGQEALMIRGDLMRRDVLDRGRAYSYLFDFKAHRITIIDHALRQAEVVQLDEPRALSAKATKAGFDMDLEKTGRQHAVRHWKCDEHSLRVSMPAELGGERVNFQLAGSVWLAKGTPEQKEMDTFRDAAASPEFLVGLPAVAKITEDQALAIGETMRRLVSQGVLCAFDVQSRYEGAGRMASLSQKVPTRLGLTYDNFRVEALNDHLFTVPAGYEVVRKANAGGGASGAAKAHDSASTAREAAPEHTKAENDQAEKSTADAANASSKSKPKPVPKVKPKN
jgi:ribosomal protein L12E/L44/L45/RPP1/RPP2